MKSRDALNPYLAPKADGDVSALPPKVDIKPRTATPSLLRSLSLLYCSISVAFLLLAMHFSGGQWPSGLRLLSIIVLIGSLLLVAHLCARYRKPNETPVHAAILTWRQCLLVAALSIPSGFYLLWLFH